MGSDSRTFVYDAIDRLTQMTSGRYGTDAYAYDPLGNVRTNGATTWHYDAATNRVSDENGTAYGNDARGNVTSIGSFVPTWNLANEQVVPLYNGDPMEWAYSVGTISIDACRDEKCTPMVPTIAGVTDKYRKQFKRENSVK